MTEETNAYPFTAESIGVLRDGSHLSWAKVAQALKLGSPGAARRAYTVLVRPHTESVLPNREAGAAKRGCRTAGDLHRRNHPEELREAIAGRTVVVQRGDTTEDIHVMRVTSVKAGHRQLQRRRQVPAASRPQPSWR